MCKVTPGPNTQASCTCHDPRGTKQHGSSHQLKGSVWTFRKYTSMETYCRQFLQVRHKKNNAPTRTYAPHPLCIQTSVVRIHSCIVNPQILNHNTNNTKLGNATCIQNGSKKSTLLHLFLVSFKQSFVCPTGRNHTASYHRFPCFHHKSALATRWAYLFIASRFSCRISSCFI